MNKIRIIFSIAILIMLSKCIPEFDSIEFQKELGVKLVDSSATRETVLLFYNLKKLPQDSIIFGHHHSTAYGVFWQGDSNRSDVKDVTGSFPGVYGWDFAEVTNVPDEPVHKDLSKLTLEAFNRGGVNIYAWHYNNPVTGNIFYDTTVAVKHILPGGSVHQKYKEDLESIARFSKSLYADEDLLVPIIFRPFHEFDGSWFWWGKNFVTKDEFIQLWRFTVTYLRDSLCVNNMLYAFSPDRNFDSDSLFLDRYPGDDYVDLLGMDNYWDFTPEGDGLDAVKEKLKIVSGITARKNKIAAFTETGLEGIPDTTWWTDKLLYAIRDDSINIAFVMVWRNADNKHHYAPYKGHLSERNFIEFKNDPTILFGDELPNLYKLEK
ncbi:MAG: beta-mannosidase [Melioribacteraceae bacterium]|nr:beta-mannosidase [Melioribacteraceae bacterium]